MTWASYHRRGEILRAVIAETDRRRDGRLPLDVVPGARRVFIDDLDLVGALQLRWHTRLAGRIERELARQPLDLEAAVVVAWCETAAALPGVRAVLDHHRTNPVDERMDRAMATATAKEQTLLAVAAGRCAATDAAGPRLGAEIERRARAADLAAV